MDLLGRCLKEQIRLQRGLAKEPATQRQSRWNCEHNIMSFSTMVKNWYSRFGTRTLSICPNFHLLKCNFPVRVCIVFGHSGFKLEITVSWESACFFSAWVKLLCLSDCKKRAPTRTMEQRIMVGARMWIMWEEQLVDPPTDYITSVNIS